MEKISAAVDSSRHLSTPQHYFCIILLHKLCIIIGAVPSKRIVCFLKLLLAVLVHLDGSDFALSSLISSASEVREER